MSQQMLLEQPTELRDLVRNTLARSPHFIGRDLRVDLEHRDVILRGAVSTYYQKQVAQESVRKIAGVGSIRNELEVVGA